MSDIRTQLLEEQADSEWSSLIPHAKRDALIIVDGSLDLVDVGVAIASDNVSLVQRWMDARLIRKPSQTELSAWNDEPTKQFRVAIVQPFVLVRAI